MSQVIEFTQDWFAEVEGSGTPGRLRQVAFRTGATLNAEVRPVDGEAEPTADLRLADGTTALHVPVSRFAVVGVRTKAA
jgi:hypothetical protein